MKKTIIAITISSFFLFNPMDSLADFDFINLRINNMTPYPCMLKANKEVHGWTRNYIPNVISPYSERWIIGETNLSGYKFIQILTYQCGKHTVTFKTLYKAPLFRFSTIKGTVLMDDPALDLEFKILHKPVFWFGISAGANWIIKENETTANTELTTDTTP